MAQPNQVGSLDFGGQSTVPPLCSSLSKAIQFLKTKECKKNNFLRKLDPTIDNIPVKESLTYENA